MNILAVEAELLLAGMPRGFDWFARVFRINATRLPLDQRKQHLFRYPTLSGSDLSACGMVNQCVTYHHSYLRKNKRSNNTGKLILMPMPPACHLCMRRLLVIINKRVTPEYFTTLVQGAGWKSIA